MPRTWDYGFDILNRSDKAINCEELFIQRDGEGWELAATSMTSTQLLFVWKRPYVNPRLIPEQPEELI